jgi:hypothetical protein
MIPGEVYCGKNDRGAKKGILSKPLKATELISSVPSEVNTGQRRRCHMFRE